MMAFTQRTRYQWFQVAELGYDTFMIRSDARCSNRCRECERPGALLRGVFISLRRTAT